MTVAKVARNLCGLDYADTLKYMAQFQRQSYQKVCARPIHTESQESDLSTIGRWKHSMDRMPGGWPGGICASRLRALYRYVRGMCGFMRVALARIEQDHPDQAADARALLCVLSVLPSRGLVHNASYTAT